MKWKEKKPDSYSFFSPYFFIGKNSYPIAIINQLINHHHHHRHLEWKTKIMKTENIFGMFFIFRGDLWAGGWLFTFECYWILLEKIKHLVNTRKWWFVFGKKTETKFIANDQCNAILVVFQFVNDNIDDETNQTKPKPKT